MQILVFTTEAAKIYLNTLRNNTIKTKLLQKMVFMYFFQTILLSSSMNNAVGVFLRGVRYSEIYQPVTKNKNSLLGEFHFFFL